MKRLCFGALFSLAYSARGPKVTNESLCKALFEAFCENVFFDSSLPGHLKTGRDNVPPDIIAAARNSSLATVKEYFSNKILPLIKDSEKKPLVRAVKAILREDSSIDNDACVGYTDGYQKSNIVGSTTFDFAELLANVFYYAIAQTVNTECKDGLSEISKCLSNCAEGEEIYFESETKVLASPLKKTANGDFDRVFSRVTDLSVPGTANPTAVRIYQVNVNNFKFKFGDLKEYLINNIGTYVYSRTKIQSFERSGQAHTIALRAINVFMKNRKDKNGDMGNILGEMLLYLFLEHELNAPKIMSKIEIETSGDGIVSKSDGVHLLLERNADEPFNQLVFGASDIVGNLRQATDRAFKKIAAVAENEDNELQMVESTVFGNIYDAETSNFMKSLLIPQKGTSVKPDTAFGVFLGYTIDMSCDGMNNNEFREAVKAKLGDDIRKIEPYICEKIRLYGLEGYSFYFYILPFNDAPSEKQSIISEMLPGGDS